ncbi:flagellar protein FilC [Halovibrio salipaludis]|uniref:Flagellar protein FilC n=1 Tax=Halovibrio salipaludis TaxID=2032626 RepID=A0A2A2F9J8_9GAMM|nr:flagellar protein FilC [Halovibrio salipaludis]PAU81282.1 flagellar protein FilC [Halovibrio salipaludis]
MTRSVLWLPAGLVVLSALAVPAVAQQQEDDGATVDEAREALAQQEGDEDSTEQLEEVFQAAEKNYSLLQAGRQSLNYSFDYSYSGTQNLDLEVINSQVRNLDVTPEATHNFTNAFSYDYGFYDNLTLGTRIPLTTKFDTQEDLNVNDVGDISFTARWQPNPHVPGTMSTTLFGTLSSKTGVSPYEIDVNRQLSTGSGYYSIGGGASVSKVLDPVVLFGSGSLRYNHKVKDLKQVRGARLLRELDPGFTLSGSGGFSYSLSYDISLSLSVQLTYNDETVLSFSDGTEATASSQMAGIINMSLGTRISDQTIVNTSVGFGMTRGAPDFTIGFSMPINISGLSESS